MDTSYGEAGTTRAARCAALVVQRLAGCPGVEPFEHLQSGDHTVDSYQRRYAAPIGTVKQVSNPCQGTFPDCRTAAGASTVCVAATATLSSTAHSAGVGTPAWLRTNTPRLHPDARLSRTTTCGPS